MKQQKMKRGLPVLLALALTAVTFNHHLFPEMKEMKNTKYTLSDIKVKVSGNTAWATFKYAISADIGTRHLDGAGLGTAVLEKRGPDWRIVHWHSSAPRRAPNPAASPTPRP